MSFRLFQSPFSAPASQVVRREKRRVQAFLVPSTLLQLTCVKSKTTLQFAVFFCLLLIFRYAYLGTYFSLSKKYAQSRFLLRQSNVKRESKIARKEPDKTSGCQIWFLNSASTIGITVISVSFAESTRCNIYLSITDRSSFVVILIYFCQVQIFVQFMLSCDTCISPEKMSLNNNSQIQPNL